MRLKTLKEITMESMALDKHNLEEDIGRRKMHINVRKVAVEEPELSQNEC